MPIGLLHQSPPLDEKFLGKCPQKYCCQLNDKSKTEEIEKVFFLYISWISKQPQKEVK